MLEDMGFGPDEISILVVWMPMLPFDRLKTAEKASRIYATFPHVVQFYDPKKIVGRAVAGSMGASGKTAWDMYLFYPRDVSWAETPPQPFAWVHQLGADPWAGRAQFKWGADLPPALVETMRRLLESMEGRERFN